MLENGADSYLLKNAGADELFTAIEKISAQEKFISAEIDEILKKDRDMLHYKSPVLTRREKEVLVEIAEGLTNQEIAEKLFISPLTVISHRKSLMEKTQTKNTAQMIKYCFQNGLL